MDADPRAAYDAVAADYARLLMDDSDELAAKPADRAWLDAFVARVDGAGLPPRVLDLGCGPGRVTAYLAARAPGVEVVGCDPSTGMLAEARRRFPALAFAVGSWSSPGATAGSLGGLLGWYSLIHTPPAERPAALVSAYDALAPGGWLLLAFQTGADEGVELQRPYGHDVALVAYRLDLDAVVRDLETAGFAVVERVRRDPVAPERTPQGYVLAQRGRRPGSTDLHLP